MALELGAGRWLQWLYETLGTDLYFLISYDFIYKVFSLSVT
jgi:hypothetical protein